MSDVIGPVPLNSQLAVDEGGNFARWTQPWKNWMTIAQRILFAASHSGTTAQRPTETLWTGRTFYDTTLNRPIWWTGTNWIRADGTVV